MWMKNRRSIPLTVLWICGGLSVCLIIGGFIFPEFSGHFFTAWRLLFFAVQLFFLFLVLKSLFDLIKIQNIQSQWDQIKDKESEERLKRLRKRLDELQPEWLERKGDAE